MALGETANLAINLQLKGNAAAGIAGVNRQLQGLNATVNRTSTGWYKMGTGLGTLIRTMAVGAVALGGILTGLVIQSVREGQEAQNVQLKFAQAIANSGKNATVTASKLAAMNAIMARQKPGSKEYKTLEAQIQGATAAMKVMGPVTAAQTKLLIEQQAAILDLAGVDDELVKSVQTQLIQYGLAGEAVQKLTLLSFEAAKATGRDVSAVALAVGKSALGTATGLQKIGIFVDKAKYKLDPYGETLRALSRYTGTLAATSGTLDVRMGALRQKMANVREEMGIRLLPVITRIVRVIGDKVVPAFASFMEKIGPDIERVLGKFADWLQAGGAQRAISAISKIVDTLVGGLKIVLSLIEKGVSAFQKLPAGVQKALAAGVLLQFVPGVKTIEAGAATIGKDFFGGLIKGGGEAIGNVITKAILARGTVANPMIVADVTNVGILGTLKQMLPGALALAPLAGFIASLPFVLAGDTPQGSREGAMTDAQYIADLRKMQAEGRGSEIVGAGGITVDSELKRLLRAGQAQDRLRYGLIGDTAPAIYKAVKGGAEAGAEAGAKAGSKAGILAGFVTSGLFGLASVIRTMLGVRTSSEVLNAYNKGQPINPLDVVTTSQAVAAVLISKLGTPGNEEAELHSAVYQLTQIKDAQKNLPKGMRDQLAPVISGLEGAIDELRVEIALKNLQPIINILQNTWNPKPKPPTAPSGRGGETKPKPAGQTAPPGRGGATRPSGARYELEGASGLSGMVHSATRMLVGEAGSEYVAVLRNPRAALLPQSQPATLNINVRTAISARQNDRGTAVQRRWGPTPTMAHAR